ncbi:hypothetical protein GIB67_011111 [Kingdonia uniflora]|uniref:C-terminal processing peptidase n=1 Tax=Kingdonia uniflora TaxID=39325 RepID=A0A7J7PAM3_9MAGN|nr:hypothetical protein GIB67_011111 [Kingdonia uniflora]
MESFCPKSDLTTLHNFTLANPKSSKTQYRPSHLYQFQCSSLKKWSKGVERFRVQSQKKFEREELGKSLVRSIGRGLVGFAAVIYLCCDSPAFSESLTVAFPVSRAHEVNTVQITLIEAWGLIRDTFVDPTFNHQDWDMKLQQTMVEMFPLRSADAAYKKLSGMLATLGDPFTRIISPKEYQNFRIGSDGNLQGVGLFINAEPSSGHLVSETLKNFADVTFLLAASISIELDFTQNVSNWMKTTNHKVRNEKHKQNPKGPRASACSAGQLVLGKPKGPRINSNHKQLPAQKENPEGGPADRAGIHEGDELIEIDGERLAGVDGETAAQKLRGRVGTTVTVKLQNVINLTELTVIIFCNMALSSEVLKFDSNKPSKFDGLNFKRSKNKMFFYLTLNEVAYVVEQEFPVEPPIPVPAVDPDLILNEYDKTLETISNWIEGKTPGRDSGFREVTLPREFIKISPISSAVIFHKSPDGHLSKTGYVKLSAFSQTAATEMENAVQEMEGQGVQSYILDLRNNPGGLVTAGLDVAQIWLDGDETLVNTIDRDGNMLPINMVDGHALTRDPLVVLVNEGSASASEILAGALHDNGRAVLVGNKTFGKGKIQSVTELPDGSALFITVAKYMSPAFHDIDQVGIAPDVQCTTDMLISPKESYFKEKNATPSLEADSCILVAEHELDIQQSKGSPS